MESVFQAIKSCNLLITAIIFCSCSSTNLLTISVLEPSPVHVTTDIVSVGIINRSIASEKTEKIDKIDQVLSVEGKNLDKEGAHESVLGLIDELTIDNRFDNVELIEIESKENPGIGVFPSPLPWDRIEQICDENGVDAIFELSLFDTDANINYKAVPVEVVSVVGIKIPAIEHHANISTLIKIGWRLYDMKKKLILDEYEFSENVTSTGVGINPAIAAKAVIGRKEAVLQVSNNMGHSYATRLSPYRIRVPRDYFVKGTNNFKIARRRAQTGNWNGAAELWENELANPKRKVAGRATYNMAIINEINGDLDTAIEWASRSYTDYKNKKALRYLNILRSRVQRQQQLQNPLE